MIQQLLRFLITLVIAVATVSLPTAAYAIDYDLDLTLSSGASDNLFSESASHYSNNNSSSLDFAYYPISFAKINLVGEYTYYRQFSRLSNLVYGGGLTLIPFSDSSRFSLFLTGNGRKRDYREVELDSAAISANEFTGNEYDALIAVGFDLTQSVQLRTGFSATSIAYNTDGVNDRINRQLFAGSNITLFNRISFDLEIGHTAEKYQYINPLTQVIGSTELKPRRQILPDEQYDILLEDNLRSVYWSSRLSTSIGRKTGVSLVYSRRKFAEANDRAIVYGYSTGFLSPWINSFEGDASSVTVKSYLVPRLILTLSAGYWTREHFNTVEAETRPNPPFADDTTTNLAFAKERSDWRSRVSFNLQWPLIVSGIGLEPSLLANYTDNKSTVPFYDFHNFSISVALTIKY